MRVIIAGGRLFTDYDRLLGVCKRIMSKRDTVVCGMAPGADMLGMKFAEDNMLDVRTYPAAWQRYGKRAGILRNVDMAQNADALIAFWDGESRGTKHMIDTALDRGLDVHVYRYTHE